MITSFLLEKSPRYFLYALFFLLPIFIVPGLALPFDLQKQMLIAIAVLGAGVLWAADVLRKGEVSFRWHILFAPLGIFVLAAFISVLGSGSFSHSFWGANAEPDSFLNIFLLAIVFGLIANKLDKREHATHAVGFFVGGAALGAILLFANSLVSFPFPFGSAYAFAVYAGGAFLLAMLYSAHAGKGTYGAYLTYAAAAVLFLALLFVSQWVAWAGVALGSFLLVYFLIANRSKALLAIPLAALMLSLTFWLVGNPLDGMLKTAPEVRLGRQATIGIAKSTVSASIKNALFGSGPATFGNQYRLYRSPSVNNSPFWNIAFDRGAGAITGFFATAGVLGGGAIALFWLWFLWFCAKFLLLLKKKESPTVDSAVLIGGVYFFIVWLLYSIDFTLLLMGFAFVALWVALRGKQIKIRFSQSPSSMFWGMTGSVAVLVGLVFAGYSLLRNYSAEASYWRGVAYVETKEYSSAIPALQKAAQIVEFDKYFRKLSQAMFLQASVTSQDESLSQEARNDEAQKGLGAAEASALLAAEVNPKNSINFEQLGDFYTSIIPVSDKAVTLPFPHYGRASGLDPQNPHIPFKKAKAHFTSAKRFERSMADARAQINSLRTGESAEAQTQISDLEQRIAISQEAYGQALANARMEAERALALKGDFADALEFLAGLPK